MSDFSSGSGVSTSVTGRQSHSSAIISDGNDHGSHRRCTPPAADSSAAARSGNATPTTAPAAVGETSVRRRKRHTGGVPFRDQTSRLESSAGRYLIYRPRPSHQITGSLLATGQPRLNEQPFDGDHTLQSRDTHTQTLGSRTKASGRHLQDREVVSLRTLARRRGRPSRGGRGWRGSSGSASRPNRVCNRKKTTNKESIRTLKNAAVAPPISRRLFRCCASEWCREHFVVQLLFNGNPRPKRKRDLG